ncbi:MAG: mechanosensitive ion channel [Cyclobacteriaceae bacterium]
MNILSPREYQQEVSQTNARHSVWIGTYIILALGFFLLYFLLNHNNIAALNGYPQLLRHAKNIALVAGVACIILMISRFVERTITRRNETLAARYNLIRLIRLLAVIMIIMAGASILFENWYTAAVSLGLISLLVGFALQTPITSLIGWLYIVIRTPYRVGDRIQIEAFTGDIVEINYLDTTLWEFKGDYLTNDLPTGRLIRFPNSLVLQSAVFNYSWSRFPYLWNEIPFHIAYESDMKYVEETIKRITREELDQDMDEKIENLKDYMKNTPIGDVDIKEYPFVSFRTNTNTWVEAMVTYLVKPKKATDVRTRIVKRVVSELLKEPDRVMFPKSNAR